jgi:plasmid stabilization system protein ParE
MKRDVLLTRQAEADLDAILSWLAKRSHRGAKNWLAVLEAAIDWLEDNAASCPVAPENDAFVQEIRERLFKTNKGQPYRLLFVLAGRQVRILHIRGPGQDFIRPR